ncbi:MAG TPA: hypothetical protein VIG64_04810 [Actinomycetota bacterium]|jgi:hypothetical protein
MAPDGEGLGSALTKLPERVAALVELISTLDLRVRAALDGLEEMRTTVTGFESLGTEGDRLAADLRARIETTDARINRDLDDLKAALMAKIGEVDLADIGPRFQRIEEAILNIEIATVNLDQNFEGALEMLPNFMTRRVKEEGKKAAPTTTVDLGR